MSIPSSDIHHRALRAAEAVTGRRLKTRAALSAAVAIALFGVDIASPRAAPRPGPADHASLDADTSGATFGAHAKGCFAWGPPAPPRLPATPTPIPHPAEVLA